MAMAIVCNDLGFIGIHWPAAQREATNSLGLKFLFVNLGISQDLLFR